MPRRDPEIAKSPPSPAGFLFAYREIGSADLAERREGLKQPDAELADTAVHKSDAGQHQKRAHRLIDAPQVFLEARKEGGERLDGEGRDHERDAQAQRIDREQERTARDRLLGLLHGQYLSKDQHKKKQPNESEGESYDVSAPQSGGRS